MSSRALPPERPAVIKALHTSRSAFPVAERFSCSAPPSPERFICSAPPSPERFIPSGATRPRALHIRPERSNRALHLPLVRSRRNRSGRTRCNCFVGSTVREVLFASGRRSPPPLVPLVQPNPPRLLVLAIRPYLFPFIPLSTLYSSSA